MSATEEILDTLPVDSLAQRLGAEPDQIRQAAAAALPALLGGMQVNASQGGMDSLARAVGQHSPGLLQGGVNLDEVDTQDGAAITRHVFGGNTDQVINQLGRLTGSGGSALVNKLLPILAPLVMAYLAGKVGDRLQGGGSAPQPDTGSGGRTAPAPQPRTAPAPQPRTDSGPSDATGNDATTSNDSIFGGGPAGGAASGGSTGGGFGDILGQVLTDATQSQSTRKTSRGTSGGSIITDILGGLLGAGRR
ncbi:MAG: hypothetical protein CSA58_12140 [Micrococcales bacterium]|nr:MAG: hypothetical protein CSB46_00230 [Micrococcales bacterium]PIE25934.1 MAG: hypothetical protein CSA58_12140 [Micrococcales bacterium]